MLPAWLILEVRRLLDAGELSQRQIAARLNVSRGTVGAVANGGRGLHGKESNETPPGDEPPLPPERCLQCGGMVYLPCVLCETRAYRRRVKLLLSAPSRRQPPPARRTA